MRKTDKEQQQLEALNVIQEFLLETMEALPEQLADVTRQLQNAATSTEHHAANTKAKLRSALAAVERQEQAMGYLKQVIMALSDTATMASILPPLITRFRQLVESGDLELGFDEVEGGPEDHRTIADRGGTDDH